jgi:quercetin dioxygenase-like cupin family protein
MSLASKSLDSPDEVREFASHGRVEVVNLPSGPVGKGTFEPGWRWSEHVKPLAGTDSCEVPHVGYVISGRMKIVMDDGAEKEAAPGDVVHIDPGHDAWTVGEEPCVLVDFGGLQGYAMREE